MPTKQETIVYGGAFNPPTIAHHAILQACVDHARQIGAEIWVLPSGNRTDKIIDAAEKQRITYLQALIRDLNTRGVTIRIDTTELTRGVDVETYDTVKEFEHEYPNRHFIWVFGADSTQTMRDWKQGGWLMANVDMILLARSGSRIHPAVEHFTALTIPTMNVSSTELRRRLAAGESYRDLVTASVYELLQRQYAGQPA